MDAYFEYKARAPKRGHYEVRTRADNGQYISDPLNEYRHAPKLTAADFDDVEW